ncbi:MAG: exosortase-associated EpsI family protein [Phycisphaerales bacterium]|nr:exosortase-associated EpsI family protein [Phycisphaerales bacterium]
MLSRLAIPLTLVLLVIAGVLRADQADPAIAEGYHAEILDAVEHVPLDFGDWEGEEVPLPPAAISLLKPNALLARQYTNKQRGVRATLMIVQCQRIRDMEGHYPPRCYPAHGWAMEQERPPTVAVGDVQLQPYRFNRVIGDQTHTITVYNLFALPTGETSVSMAKVREVGSDYPMRPYGAAQIQIVMDESVAPEDHAWVLEELYAIARPTVEVVVENSAQNREGQPNGK